MEDRKRTVIAVVVALIVVLALGYSFGMNFLSPKHELVLPDPNMAASPSADVMPSGDAGGIEVEVTAQTVQNAVATLFRYESYNRSVAVTYYWEPEQSETMTAQVWVDGGWTRTDTALSNGTVEHSITDEDTLWLWYTDGAQEHSGEIWQGAAVEMASDLMQRIPTYEDILLLEQDLITAADYVAYQGQPCIYVETRQNELGYLYRYWISVSNGLLIAAQTEKNGLLVYEMTSGEVMSPLPAGLQTFILPNGRRLHSVD